MVCRLLALAALLAVASALPSGDLEAIEKEVLGESTVAVKKLTRGELEYCKLDEYVNKGLGGCTSLWLEQSFAAYKGFKESEPVDALLADISTNPQVGSIVIKDAEIGDAGAVKIAEAIGANKTGLHSLALMNCGVGDAGATALAKAVNVSKLDRLQLKGNKLITLEGAEALASAHENIGVFNTIQIGKYNSGEWKELNVYQYTGVGVMEATMFKALLNGDNPITDVHLGMYMLNSDVLKWMGMGDEEEEKEEL